MKTPKCPLCGKMPEYVRFMVGEEECDHICCTCGLCTSPISGLLGKTQCWEDWSELVAKFPPIMRVCLGDVVIWENTPVTVIDKDVQYGELLVINSQGSKFLLDPQDIEKWPWEIEQKGDAE